MREEKQVNERNIYIEDDVEIGSIVKEDLEQRGYLVRWLTSGEGSEERLVIRT